MHEKLVSSNILEFDQTKMLIIKANLGTINPKYNEDANEPDELNILSNDELEGLSERDIILTTLVNDDQTIHSADLLDIAADTEIQDVDDVSTGSLPDTSELESSSLKSSSSSMSSNQTVMAKATIQEHSVNIDDKMSHLHSGVNVDHVDDSKKSTHVFYKDRWYHINQFIAWEQGKFYMPSQARLSRFYSNYVVFDKFINSNSNSKTSEIIHNTYVATWNNGRYNFGIVKRIIQMPTRGKSAVPIFNWNKSKTQEVEIAINILLPVRQDKFGLSQKFKLSNTYMWVSMKEYVTNLIGQWQGDLFILNEECYLELLKVMEQLKKQDELEEQKKREAKKRKHDEMKKGPPEKMTVCILKTLLQEKGVRFPSNSKKADLVQLVRQELRAQNTSDNTQDIAEQFEVIQLNPVKKEQKKKIIVKQTRTIFISYVEIPYDLNKHFFYKILCYVLQLMSLLGMLSVMSVVQIDQRLSGQLVILILLFWFLVITYHILLVATVNLLFLSTPYCDHINSSTQWVKWCL